MDLYNTFFEDPDLKVLLGKSLKGGQEELLVCRHDLPVGNETEIFEIITVTRDKKIIHKV